MMLFRSHAAAGAMATAMLGLASASQAEDSVSTLSVLTARESFLAAFESMPEPQLKKYFLMCSRESSQRMLDFDDAVRCSMANDALLKRSFGGDFGELISWWRIHRNDPGAQ